MLMKSILNNRLPEVRLATHSTVVIGLGSTHIEFRSAEKYKVCPHLSSCSTSKFFGSCWSERKPEASSVHHSQID